VSPERKASHWYFDYAPISIGGGDTLQLEQDLVLATVADVDPASIVELLAGVVPDVEVTPLFSGHPIFWTRVRSSQPIDRNSFQARLESSSISVRYIVATCRGSQRLAPRLDCATARPRRPLDWKAREATTAVEPQAPWRWFLRTEGANVARTACGTGAGARLAVIDNDGLDLDRVELDAEVLVGVDTVPRASGHAALLIGWAVGAQTTTGGRFRGVAPDASVRFYCIPKSANEVLSLPLGIVRAVNEGADVVVCATYVEGQTSPLLDDALEFARQLGRGGKGAAVVFPTGREMSSLPGSVHSSLSLGMAEPASDPRVFCVGPSARTGDWFLWRDRKGKLRPFSNRGPAIRWLAPGDDMANPFLPEDRPGHAESSGAAGIATGVMALVIACNPELTLAEVDGLLQETAVDMDASRQTADAELADTRDLLPLGTDADGHNAKHGYGRLDAAAACMSSRDPVAFALIRTGHAAAAAAYLKNRADDPGVRVYGDALARWTVRAMLFDAGLVHACCAVVRACRLLAPVHSRGLAEAPGSLLRQLGIIVRLFLDATPPAGVASELVELDQRIYRAQEGNASSEVDTAILSLAKRVFECTDETRPVTSDRRPNGTRAGSMESSSRPLSPGFSGSRSS
jgi:hypothetical protein